MYEATGGAVSPLVGRALEEWGYDASYRLQPQSVIAPVPSWDDVLRWDGEYLDTLRPVVLDIGAAGKGLLVDLVAAELRAADVDDFTIDAGGDILHRGSTPLRVALEHPLDPTRAIGVARVPSGAICASAANRRAWPGAHHVIDAVTGRPTAAVVATWVTAATTMVADGLATAMFFADAAVLAKLAATYEFEWVRIMADGVVERSPGFDGEVFT